MFSQKISSLRAAIPGEIANACLMAANSCLSLTAANSCPKAERFLRDTPLVAALLSGAAIGLVLR